MKSEVTHLDGVQLLLRYTFLAFLFLLQSLFDTSRPRRLSLLHSHNNLDILWNVIWSLVQLSSYEDNKREIRLMGGIPLILAILW